MSEQNNSQDQAAANPAFAIQRIYLKDLSFETPMGAEAFGAAFKPNIQQDLNVQVNPIEKGLYEIVLLLTITATAPQQENRTVFLVEVKQAGLFAIQGLNDAAVTQLANTACPQILFPYAREAIDSVLNRGTFPPLMLPPINFDAMFVQALEQAQQQAKAKAAEAAPASIN